MKGPDRMVRAFSCAAKTMAVRPSKAHVSTMVDLYRLYGRMVDMSLNIKNENTHRMAQELARATGESMTVAVSEAIRERLERVRGKSKQGMAEKLMKIGEECSARLKGPLKPMEIDDLYDERGLWK